MNCPNCKAVGTLHVYKGSPVYVGCEAPGCHWNQEPLTEFVIEAAVKTFERATAPRTCEHCSDQTSPSPHKAHAAGKCLRIVYRGDYPDGWNESCGCDRDERGAA